MGIDPSTLPPHVRLAIGEAIPVKEHRAPRHTGAFAKGKQKDLLEGRFLSHWTLLGGPELAREFVAVPDRKWRFDFAHLASKTLIEIHGATFTGGRHTTGTGFGADREKMNAAQLLGWRVIELTANDIKADRIESLIASCSSPAAGFAGEREGGAQ